MKSYAAMLGELKGLLMADLRSAVERGFAIGDQMIRMQMVTQLRDAILIRKIREDLEEVPYSTTFYQRNLRIAKAFSEHDRAVLIEKLVPIGKVETLARQDFEKDRKKWVDRIRTGKTKAPFRSLVTSRSRENATKTERIREALKEPDAHIVLRAWKDGEISVEQLSVGLGSLLSQVDEQNVLEALNAGVERLSKSGKSDLRRFALVG